MRYHLIDGSNLAKVQTILKCNVTEDRLDSIPIANGVFVGEFCLNNIERNNYTVLACDGSNSDCDNNPAVMLYNIKIGHDIEAENQVSGTHYNLHNIVKCSVLCRCWKVIH